MTCRCTPVRACLNCERAAELKAINAAKDRAEAIARGKRRYAANARDTRGW